MNRCCIGIDPGGSGAIAVIFRDGRCRVWDNDPDPVVQAATWREVMVAVATEENKLAALELVSAMKGQGVSSTFKFGKAAGGIEHLLAYSGIPYILVSPSKWQKAVFDSRSEKGETKERSLATARRLFPTVDLSRKKDHNRADAILMAEYLRRQP